MRALDQRSEVRQVRGCERWCPRREKNTTTFRRSTSSKQTNQEAIRADTLSGPPVCCPPLSLSLINGTSASPSSSVCASPVATLPSPRRCVHLARHLFGNFLGRCAAQLVHVGESGPLHTHVLFFFQHGGERGSTSTSRVIFLIFTAIHPSWLWVS